MKNQELAIVFDKDRALKYDSQFKKMDAFKDALHLCMQLKFADLPENANILCVGAGTGAEILAMAKIFPNWQFTAVEPSGPMLTVCRKKAEAAGITARCTFHEGYIDSLPESGAFDAATSILVSQFIMDDMERIAFFKAINNHLKPAGLLISADISADLESKNFASLKNVWLQMMLYCGMPEESVHNMIKPFGETVSVQSLEKTANLIAKGGFTNPILFCQTLLIHAWYAEKV